MDKLQKVRCAHWNLRRLNSDQHSILGSVKPYVFAHAVSDNMEGAVDTRKKYIFNWVLTPHETKCLTFPQIYLMKWVLGVLVLVEKGFRNRLLNTHFETSTANVLIQNSMKFIKNKFYLYLFNNSLTRSMMNSCCKNLWFASVELIRSFKH